MRKIFTKCMAAIPVYLGICLLHGATSSHLPEHEHHLGHNFTIHKGDEHHCPKHASVMYTDEDYSIEREYKGGEVTTKISSTEPLSSTAVQRITRNMLIMDLLGNPPQNRHVHTGRHTVPQHDLQHERIIHHHDRITHRDGIIRTAIQEVREIGRDCIEITPWPIKYFLGFWPIRPVLDTVFPKQKQHHHDHDGDDDDDHHDHCDSDSDHHGNEHRRRHKHRG